MAVNQARKMSPQDESVWFKVRIALKINSETESFFKDIKIGINRGVVTLEGAVASEDAARAVTRVVQSVPDVLRVINNLKIS